MWFCCTLELRVGSEWRWQLAWKFSCSCTKKRWANLFRSERKSEVGTSAKFLFHKVDDLAPSLDNNAYVGSDRKTCLGGTYHVTLQVTNSFDFIPECVGTRLTCSLPFVGVAALAFGNVSSEGVNVPFRLWGFFLQERYQIVSGGCSEGRDLLVIE